MNLFVLGDEPGAIPDRDLSLGLRSTIYIAISLLLPSPPRTVKARPTHWDHRSLSLRESVPIPVRRLIDKVRWAASVPQAGFDAPETQQMVTEARTHRSRCSHRL